MCLQVIASVGSWMEEKAHLFQGKELLGEFTIDPLIGHVVGKKLLSGIDLAPVREKRLQWCGNYALPYNTTLVVGEVIYCGYPAWSIGKPRKDDFEIIIDCGIPVRCVQVGAYRFPSHASEVRRKDIYIGSWLAFLGFMRFQANENSKWGVWVRVLERKILDLRVGSPTFTQLIEWEFDAALPYDDTELPFSPNYYLFEVLGQNRE